MIGAIKRVREEESLVAAARGPGLPFETSPTGRFIRLSGQRGVVYVVQDAWGSGCTVMEMSSADRRMEHFLSCAPASRRPLPR